MSAESIERRRWRRGILFFGIACGMLLVVAALQWRPQSETPPRFRDDKFRQIPIGMPVNEVFDAIGYPFTFVVHSLRPGGSWNPPVDWSAPVIYTDIKDAAPFLTNPNHQVTLEYSKPRREGGSFRARQVAIQNGQVILTFEYTYWAFLD